MATVFWKTSGRRGLEVSVRYSVHILTIIGLVPISILKKKGVPLLNELHIFLREKTTQADTFGELRA